MEMVCNKLIVDSCLISSLIFLLLLFNAAVASTAVGDDNRPVEGGGTEGETGRNPLVTAAGERQANFKSTERQKNWVGGAMGEMTRHFYE